MSNYRNTTVKNVITCGALVLSSTFFCGFGFPGSSAQESALAGTQLLQGQRYEEALANFKQAADSSLDRYLKGQCLSDSGECCLKLKRYKEARTYFEQAVPLLNGGIRGIGSREANLALVRWGLADFGLNDHLSAARHIRAAIDNSLGIWTYNYSDLANAATYIQAMVMVANAKDGSGERWYQYGRYELSRLISQGGSRAVVAQIALGRLDAFQRTSPSRSSVNNYRPRYSSDPYLSSSSQYRPSRARYGLNGTQDFLAPQGRTQAW